MGRKIAVKIQSRKDIRPGSEPGRTKSADFAGSRRAKAKFASRNAEGEFVPASPLRPPNSSPAQPGQSVKFAKPQGRWKKLAADSLFGGDSVSVRQIPVGSLELAHSLALRNAMKTALRLCFGLLLTVSAVGCHTCQSGCQSSCDSGCGHRSCLHKVAEKLRGGGGGQGACDSCGQEAGCACGQQHRSHRKAKMKYELPAEAAMYGYDKSVVYTGDDWQGMPQQMMGAMPGGCSGCAGGAPMMSTPSSGCAGCAGGGPTPAPGGCASCGGGSAPQPASGGCASCGGNHAMPSTVPSAPSVGGGCASCGAAAGNDSFYNPMGPNHHGPAPAPPAEGAPTPTIEAVPGNNAAGSGESIQKIHWVPRQL